MEENRRIIRRTVRGGRFSLVEYSVNPDSKTVPSPDQLTSLSEELCIKREHRDASKRERLKHNKRKK